jgi:hypothetical protein
MRESTEHLSEEPVATPALACERTLRLSGYPTTGTKTYPPPTPLPSTSSNFGCSRTLHTSKQTV